MRNALFVAAAALVTAGAVLIFVPFGLIVAGLAVGAVAWFSEE